MREKQVEFSDVYSPINSPIICNIFNIGRFCDLRDLLWIEERETNARVVVNPKTR
jgi:hypothetical protein